MRNINTDNYFAEAVYSTLYGLCLPEVEVPGVENLFAPGSVYENVEDEAYRLRQQLEDRLNTEDYMLVEQLVTQLYCIQKEMCLRMYDYGVKFGKSPNIGEGLSGTFVKLLKDLKTI